MENYLRTLSKKMIMVVIMILALLVAFLPTTHSCAVSLSEDIQRGSIVINMVNEDGDGIQSAIVKVYCVADVVPNGTNDTIEYKLRTEFESLKEYEDNLSSEDVAKKFLKLIQQKKITGTEQVTGKTGKVTFEDLSIGMYLVAHEGFANGSLDYYNSEPFFVSVPTQAVSIGSMDWVYNVVAYPKSLVKSERDDVTPKPNSSSNNGGNGRDEGRNSSRSGSRSEETLPQTGLLRWPIPVLSIGGVLIFLIGWGMVFFDKSSRRKRAVKEATNAK